MKENALLRLKSKKYIIPFARRLDRVSKIFHSPIILFGDFYSSTLELTRNLSEKGRTIIIGKLRIDDHKKLICSHKPLGKHHTWRNTYGGNKISGPKWIARAL